MIMYVSITDEGLSRNDIKLEIFLEYLFIFLCDGSYLSVYILIYINIYIYM